MQADVQPDLRITRQPCGPRNVQLSASCPAALMRPGLWKVEDFELHKQLYKGKASLLYSASCRRCNMPVAVKVYRKARLSELNWYQVEREIRIHSSLDHKSIICLYAAFEDDSNVYMVQEYATGGDLYEDLRRSGGKYEEAVTSAGVLRPCIEALMYLHSKGIIHRDIKPENILLMADRSIKLADFGLSIDATFERPVTRAGTLDYMAPEVLLCPEKSRPQENKDKVLLGYTSMVDAWAMGILAYELVVGRPPFEKQSRAATYEHIMYRKPECPATMSAEAKDFVFSALTKAARKRPALTDLLCHPFLQSAPSLYPLQSQAEASALQKGPAALGPPQASGQESGTITPGNSEGKFAQPGLSSSTTSSDEATDQPGPSQQSDRVDSMTLHHAAGAQVTPGVPEKARPPPLHSTASKKGLSRSTSKRELASSSSKRQKSNEDAERQTTWTASLKRGMMRMLSKTPSGRSLPLADPQANPPTNLSLAAIGATVGTPNNQALRSAGVGDQQEISAHGSGLLSRGYQPRLTTSSKLTSLKLNTVPSTISTLGLIVSQKQSKKQSAQEIRPIILSPEPAVRETRSMDVRPGTYQGRSRAANAAAMSPFGTETAQTRPLTNPKSLVPGKLKQALLQPLQEESDPLLRGPSSGPLPTALSLSRVSPVSASVSTSNPRASTPPSRSASNLTSSPSRVLPISNQASGLMGLSLPLPEQQHAQQESGQTVQQMLTAMRLSSGKLKSPRLASNDADLQPSQSGELWRSGGLKAVRESPFHSALSEKDFAQDISRRYAMGGTNGNMSAGIASADDLRGATSVPINVKNAASRAYLRAYSAEEDRLDAEAGDVFTPSAQGQLSLLGSGSPQQMVRSQSLALPANLVIEPGARSASNRHSFKRYDIAALSQRPQMQLAVEQAPPPPQRKAGNLAPRPRLTNQNLEPSLSTSWGNGKGSALYGAAESPRIKAGMA